jgi:hypothetical protein
VTGQKVIGFRGWSGCRGREMSSPTNLSVPPVPRSWGPGR